ncbi:hypothetical protein Q9966_007334 [Columba livia]|nr:hypothetical protein Q9966_007334 [Columba livia]
MADADMDKLLAELLDPSKVSHRLSCSSRGGDVMGKQLKGADDGESTWIPVNRKNQVGLEERCGTEILASHQGCSGKPVYGYGHLQLDNQTVTERVDFESGHRSSYHKAWSWALALAVVQGWQGHRYNTEEHPEHRWTSLHNSSCYQANSKANGALALGLGDAANDIRLLQFGSAGRAITEQFGILAMEMLDVYVGRILAGMQRSKIIPLRGMPWRDLNPNRNCEGKESVASLGLDSLPGLDTSVLGYDLMKASSVQCNIPLTHQAALHRIALPHYWRFVCALFHTMNWRSLQA